MGEHILKVALTELLTVRIKCKNPKCQAVTELPIDNIDLADDECPTCKTPFMLSNADIRRDKKRLHAFKDAVKDVLTMGGMYELEFPISLDARQAAKTE